MCHNQGARVEETSVCFLFECLYYFQLVGMACVRNTQRYEIRYSFWCSFWWWRKAYCTCVWQERRRLTVVLRTMEVVTTTVDTHHQVPSVHVITAFVFLQTRSPVKVRQLSHSWPADEKMSVTNAWAYSRSNCQKCVPSRVTVQYWIVHEVQKAIDRKNEQKKTRANMLPNTKQNVTVSQCIKYPERRICWK